MTTIAKLHGLVTGRCGPIWADLHGKTSEFHHLSVRPSTELGDIVLGKLESDVEAVALSFNSIDASSFGVSVAARRLFLLVVLAGCLGGGGPVQAEENHCVALSAFVGHAFWSDWNQWPFSVAEQFALGLRFRVSPAVSVGLSAEHHGALTNWSPNEAFDGGDWDRRGFSISGRVHMAVTGRSELFGCVGAGKDTEDIHDEKANDYVTGEYVVVPLRLGWQFLSGSPEAGVRIGFLIETGPDLVLEQEWRYPYFPWISRAGDRYGWGDIRWFLGLGVAGEWWP